MRARFLFVAAFTVAATAASAQAEERYISGIGVVHLGPSEEPVSIPAPEQQQSIVSPSGQFQGSGVELSNLFDKRDGRLKSYFGARIGMMNMNSGLPHAENSWTSAYQVHGGVSVDITKQLLGKLEYGLMQGEAAKLMLGGTPARVTYKRRTVMLGLSYRFQ